MRGVSQKSQVNNPISGNSRLTHAAFYARRSAMPSLETVAYPSGLDQDRQQQMTPNTRVEHDSIGGIDDRHRGSVATRHRRSRIRFSPAKIIAIERRWQHAPWEEFCPMGNWLTAAS
jgi:hypothetical protein